MIRQLSIAACIAASSLGLAGCVSDYAYRDGPGDYYYGQPTVDYNYYGAPYGSVGYGGYGYGGYYGGIGYGSGYYGRGYPYGYGGNTYIYPRYYYRDRDRDRHRDHRPERPQGDGITFNGNRNVRGSDRIPAAMERSRNIVRPIRGDDGGRTFNRGPTARGQFTSPVQRQGEPRGREMIQSRPQMQSRPQPQMRAPQSIRQAPVQRAAPSPVTRMDSGRVRVRTSEP